MIVLMLLLRKHLDMIIGMIAEKAKMMQTQKVEGRVLLSQGRVCPSIESEIVPRNMGLDCLVPIEPTVRSFCTL